MTTFKSGFALVDVTTGRAKLARLCATDHIVPVTIKGYIQPGKGGVGKDDGTSREFAMTVESAEFGEPEQVPCNKQGRIYAKLGDLKAGDTVELDGDFTCSPKKRQKVRKDAEGDLYIRCSSGKHFLTGQRNFDSPTDYLIGVFKV
jgi:hypothetical protein